MCRKSSTGITGKKNEIEKEKIDFRDLVSDIHRIFWSFRCNFFIFFHTIISTLQHTENIPVQEARAFDGHTNLNLCKDTDDVTMVNIDF